MRRTLRLLTAVFAITVMAAACGDLGPIAPADTGIDEQRGFIGEGG